MAQREPNGHASLFQVALLRNHLNIFPLLYRIFLKVADDRQLNTSLPFPNPLEELKIPKHV